MTQQTQDRQHEKRQSSKRLSWVLWTVVLVVLCVILVFTIISLLILKSQGINEGTVLLTILSIVIGTIVGLLSLLFAFLQWFHSRISNTSESSASPIQPSVITNISSSPISAQLLQSSQEPIPSIDESSSFLHFPQDEGATRGTGVKPCTQKDLHQEIWGEVPSIYQFFGREKELTEVKQWIIDDHSQIVAVLGIGGIGKTSLAAVLAEQIRHEFNSIFWCSLQNAPSLDSVLQNCIQFLSHQQQIDLPEDVNRRIVLLLHYLREYRCLIVLDNLETILQSGKNVGQYREGYEGYSKLIQCIGESMHHSCLLLTSREKPKEVARLEGKTSPIRAVQLLGLGQLEGQKILKDKNLFGPDKAWADLIRLYSGNPLALKLVSEPIREVFGGNIESFLKEGEVVVGDVYDLLNQQFHRLAELEQEILYWLAIEREGVSMDGLREDSVRAVSRGALIDALNSLRRRSMIEISGTGHFFLQPVIMEYVTNRFVESVYKEIELESRGLLARFALIKAQAKDYVRDRQVNLILEPIASHLLIRSGKMEIEKKLKR